MKKTNTANLSSLKQSWQSPFVAREQVSLFSGGTLNPRTLANHDSQSTGPEGRIRIGRKVVYPVDSLIFWMEQRSKKL
jgi:hypothetical protein